MHGIALNEYKGREREKKRKKSRKRRDWDFKCMKA